MFKRTVIGLVAIATTMTMMGPARATGPKAQIDGASVLLLTAHLPIFPCPTLTVCQGGTVDGVAVGADLGEIMGNGTKNDKIWINFCPGICTVDGKFNYTEDCLGMTMGFPERGTADGHLFIHGVSEKFNLPSGPPKGPLGSTLQVPFHWERLPGVVAVVTTGKKDHTPNKYKADQVPLNKKKTWDDGKQVKDTGGGVAIGILGPIFNPTTPPHDCSNPGMQDISVEAVAANQPVAVL